MRTNSRCARTLNFKTDKESEVCYKEDFEDVLKYKETLGLEHSWTLTWWTSLCIVLAISAVITGMVWAFGKLKRHLTIRLIEEIDTFTSMEVEIRGALIARINSLEEANESAVPWQQNMEAVLRRVDTYTDVLWEGLVENGGCLLREREDMIRKTRWEELEGIESSNLANWRRRTANRIGTPRSGATFDHDAEEEREQGDEQDGEEDSAQYGAPATEDEPEPVHARTEDEMTEPEREDPLAGLTEGGMIEMDLQDWSRRMRIVADHHEANLRAAEIRGDQDAMFEIQEELDRVLLLMDELPMVQH